MFTIREFLECDRDAVIDLVLRAQNDGTRPPKTVADQPDLLDIEKLYRDGGGNFWVADLNGEVIGSIGLMNHGGGYGILKKFFVKPEYQGAPYHVGRKLFNRLIEFAYGAEFRVIVLDTPKNTDRAHAFYYKAGFKKISRGEIPFSYDYPYADCDFFELKLK